MNVLDFALEMGEWGEQHYRKLAEESQSSGVSAVFTLLAADQRELGLRYSTVKGAAQPEKQMGSVTLDRAERLLCRLFAHGPGAPVHSDLDAYRYALRLELRLANFLERIETREKNQAAKGVLKTLADEERRLLKDIEGMREFARESRWYPSAIESAMAFDRRGGFAIN